MFSAIAILAILLPGAGSARDQGSDDLDTPASAAQEVFYETASVTARPLSQATGAVEVLDRQRLAQLAVREVAEALDFVPGVIINRTARGGLTVAEVRGGDPNFTLVLLDGVPLNDPTDSLGGAFNLASFGVLGLERIEVVRGPASSHYGSTALAGVIQLITRSGGERMALTAEAEAGDYDLERGGAWIGGPLSSRVRGSIALASEQESGRVSDDSFEQDALLAGLDTRLGATGELRLRSRLTDWQAEDYPVGAGGPLLGLGLLRQSDHRESSLGLHFDSTGGERLQHRASATYYRHRLDRSGPPIPPLVPPSIEETEFEQTRMLYRAVFRGDASHFGLGAMLERQEGSNRSLLLLPPIFGGAIPGDYLRRRDQGAVFGESTRLWASDWGSLTLEAGIRVDTPDDTAAQLSPRLGVGFRPGDRKVRLRASAGRAFKQPSFYAIASPPSLGGNPDLRPETSLGIDLGVDVEPGSNLSLGLTLFWNRYRDLIDFDFATFLLVNRTAVQSRGAETALSWSPRSWIAVDAQLTLQEVEDRDSGLELLRRPQSSAALSLRLTPLDALSLLIDLRAIGSSFDQQVGGERRQLEGRELLGFAAAFRSGRGFELRLRLDNLTDEQYQTQLGLPGARRSIRVGIGYRFADRRP